MPDTKLFYTQLALSDAFLGARTQRLADLISAQGDEFILAAGISIPARSASTILYLKDKGPSSLVQIAKALGEAHQLTAKRISALESLSMLSCKADHRDKRRRIIKLTKKGERESHIVEERCGEALRVFEDLNRQLDLQLGKILDAAHAALSGKTMLQRLDEIGPAGQRRASS